MQQVRWGVLGYARIARLNAIPAILRTPEAKLAGVASRDPAKLAECQNAFAPHKTFSTYAALLADPDIDAVYIPLPNALHKEWVIAALRAGKHVLCEKPLGLTAAEVREMIAQAEASNRLLMEGVMYRYTERARLVEAILQSGALGELRHLNASFRFWLDRADTIKEKPELGGGALFDVGCYPVSLLGLLTQAQPVSCKAVATRRNGVDVNVSAILGYESGLIANLHCGFNAFTRIHAEIIGADGMLEIPDTYLDNAGSLRLLTKEGEQEISVPSSDRFGAEFADFSAAILHGRAPKVSLAESLHNAQIMDLLQEAAR